MCFSLYLKGKIKFYATFSSKETKRSEWPRGVKLVLMGLEERGGEQKACAGDLQGMSGYQRGQRNSQELFFLGTGDVMGKVMVPWREGG